MTIFSKVLPRDALAKARRGLTPRHASGSRGFCGGRARVDFPASLGYARREMADKFFYDDAVLRAIRAILISKGVRGEEELKDATHDVVLECLVRYGEKTGRSPETVPQTVALVRSVAQGRGVDRARKGITQGKSNVGLTPDGDLYAKEPEPAVERGDWEDIYSGFRAGLKPEELEDLEAIADGASHDELAAKKGISPAAQRKRVEVARRKSKGILDAKGWVIVGGVAAMMSALGAALYFRPWEDSGNVTKRPQDYAAEQRHFAAGECKARRWDECEKALERAKEADPQGETSDEVKGMREAIEKGRGGAGGR